MKRILALLLLLASTAAAQTPVSVRYQSSNPNLTVNCSPGALVWNTSTFNPFLCNAPVDGTAPRYKSMLTAVPSSGFPFTATNANITYTLSAPTTISSLRGLRQIVAPTFNADAYDYFEFDNNVQDPVYKMRIGLTDLDSHAILDAGRSTWTWLWRTPGSQYTQMIGTNSFWQADVSSEAPGNSTSMKLTLGQSNVASLAMTNSTADSGAGWSFAPFTGFNNGFGLYAFTPTVSSGLTADNEVGQIQFRIDNLGDGTNAYYTAVPGAIELSVVADSSPAQSTTVQINTNGIRDLNVGTKPACSITTWSYRWFTFGGPGVADTYEVCMKDAGDAYAWKVLATP